MRAGFKKLQGGARRVPPLVPSSLRVALSYVLADFRRKPVSLYVGIATVTIAVFSLALAQAVLSNIGVVFMRLAEENVGENDLVLRPQREDLINATLVAERLAGNELVTGSTPRWALPARAVSRDNEDLNLETFLFVVDTQKEIDIDLGRAFDERVLNEQEAYISSAIATRLGIRDNMGDRLYVDIDLESVLSSTGTDLSNINQGRSDEEQADLYMELLGLQPDQSYVLFDSQVGDAIVTAVNDAFANAGVNTTLNNTNVDSVELTGQQIADILVTLTSNATLGNATLPSLRLEAIAHANVPDPKGKWPAVMGNVVCMDSKHLSALFDNIVYHTPVLRQLQAVLDLGLLPGESLRPQALTDVLKNPDEQAFTVTVQYEDRVKTYMKNFEALKHDIIRFSDSVYADLGVDFPAENFVPVASFLQGLELIITMFGQSFVLVDCFLILLSCLVVYSLMLDNVVERTYEFGMLRALGMVKRNITQIITMQSLTYSIPGTLLGLLLAVIAYVIIAETLLRPFAAVSLEELPFSSSAIVVAFVFGFLMPLCANYLPTRQALSYTLRGALDRSHQTFNDTKVTLIRLQKLGLHPREISVSLVCVVVGFMAYYLFPYAFLYSYLVLAFTILTLIVLGMVFGLAFVANSLQPLMEVGMVSVLVQGPDKDLRPLVRKNLAAHRKRSLKTSSIFTLSLAFIVFGSVMRTSQQNMIMDNIRLFFGTDVRISTLSTDVPLDRPALEDVLRREQLRDVEDFAFVTFPLHNTDTVTRTQETNLGETPEQDVGVLGVTENLMRVLDMKYTLVTETGRGFSFRNTGGVPDVVSSLYTDVGVDRTELSSRVVLTAPVKGLERPGNADEFQYSEAQVQGMIDEANEEYVDVIVSRSMQKLLSIGTRNFHILEFRSRRRNPNTGSRTDHKTLAKPRAVVGKLPGFSFSSYRAFARFGTTPVFMTIPAYEQLLRKMQNLTMTNEPGYTIDEGVKYRDVFVRFKPGTTNAQIDAVVDTLKNTFQSSSIEALVLHKTLASVMRIADLINYLFIIVILIACAMCFFSLTLSVYGSVTENSWEYGVMRALGVGAAKLQRAYLYEALCVVVTAMVNGTAVGMVIAILLSLFSTIFTELPLVIDFPGLTYGLVVVLSLGVTALGTYWPTTQMNRKTISNVLRGLMD